MKKSLIKFWHKRIVSLWNKDVFAVGFLSGKLTLLNCNFDKEKPATVKSFAQTDLPEDSFLAGKILDVMAVGKAFRKLIVTTKPEPLKGNKCIAVIPDDQIFFSAFFLDTLKNKNAKLSDLIEMKVEELLPLPVAEYKYVHKMRRVGDKFLIGIAAVNREVLAAYYEVLRFKANVEPKGIFAFSNALLIGYPKLISKDDLTVFLYCSSGIVRWRIYYQGIIFDSNDIIIDDQSQWESIALEDIIAAVSLCKAKLMNIPVRVIGLKDSAACVKGLMLKLNEEIKLKEIVLWEPNEVLSGLESYEKETNILLGMLKKSRNLLQNRNLLNLQV